MNTWYILVYLIRLKLVSGRGFDIKFENNVINHIQKYNMRMKKKISYTTFKLKVCKNWKTSLKLFIRKHLTNTFTKFKYTGWKSNVKQTLNRYLLVVVVVVVVVVVTSGGIPITIIQQSLKSNLHTFSSLRLCFTHPKKFQIQSTKNRRDY